VRGRETDQRQPHRQQDYATGHADAPHQRVLTAQQQAQHERGQRHRDGCDEQEVHHARGPSPPFATDASVRSPASSPRPSGAASSVAAVTTPVGVMPWVSRTLLSTASANTSRPKPITMAVSTSAWGSGLAPSEGTWVALTKA